MNIDGLRYCTYKEWCSEHRRMWVSVDAIDDKMFYAGVNQSRWAQCLTHWFKASRSAELDLSFEMRGRAIALSEAGKGRAPARHIVSCFEPTLHFDAQMKAVEAFNTAVQAAYGLTPYQEIPASTFHKAHVDSLRDIVEHQEHVLHRALLSMQYDRAYLLKIDELVRKASDKQTIFGPDTEVRVAMRRGELVLKPVRTGFKWGNFFGPSVRARREAARLALDVIRIRDPNAKSVNLQAGVTLAQLRQCGFGFGSAPDHGSRFAEHLSQLDAKAQEIERYQQEIGTLKGGWPAGTFRMTQASVVPIEVEPEPPGDDDSDTDSEAITIPRAHVGPNSMPAMPGEFLGELRRAQRAYSERSAHSSASSLEASYEKGRAASKARAQGESVTRLTQSTAFKLATESGSPPSGGAALRLASGDDNDDDPQWDNDEVFLPSHG
ncbi:hypothetical protein [Pandoraea terrae]|uniref:hypothetical protein n=1 Tax=Pandoraea terrae TaxID=1537710 RepID=UPI00124132C2|nr:hypothetical protein [Pandoraea terrae]